MLDAILLTLTSSPCVICMDFLKRRIGRLATAQRFVDSSQLQLWLCWFAWKFFRPKSKLPRMRISIRIKENYRF